MSKAGVFEDPAAIVPQKPLRGFGQHRYALRIRRTGPPVKSANLRFEDCAVYMQKQPRKTAKKG